MNGRVSSIGAVGLTLWMASVAGCGDSRASDCEPVTCELSCEFGFASGPDGCEVCACLVPPDDSCTVDADCHLGRDYTDCCSCLNGYTSSRIAAEACVVELSNPAPAGCAPSPSCDGSACRCALAVRAVCQSGACGASDTCAAGDVAHFGRCEPVCTTHADCVMAADYGSCCGGCEPYHATFVLADRCIAVSQTESMCSAGSCEGLGCASPPSDCGAFGGTAVCMESGECQAGGEGGACPGGFHEMDGRCVAD